MVSTIPNINPYELVTVTSDFLGLYDQVNKRMWWMPWQLEAKKDV